MRVYVLMSEGLDSAKEIVYAVEGVYYTFPEAQTVAHRLEKASKLTNPPTFSIQSRVVGTERVQQVWLREADGTWSLCYPLGATNGSVLWEDEADGKPDPLARNWLATSNLVLDKDSPSVV